MTKFKEVKNTAHTKSPLGDLRAAGTSKTLGPGVSVIINNSFIFNFSNNQQTRETPGFFQVPAAHRYLKGDLVCAVFLVSFL